MKKYFFLFVFLMANHLWAAKPVSATLQMHGFTKTPLIIGHRGAPGYRPEETLASYELAIEMGTDFCELDLVRTKDGVLIARHENNLAETTDVSTKFPERKTTKTIDGKKIEGWFSEDFTLKEIKTLRAKERLPFRDHSYDGKYEIATFQEIIDLVKKESKKHKRTIGLYPETKHPTYFESIGLPLEEVTIAALKHNGLNKKDSPVFLQSFELTSLKKLRKLSLLPMIYLVDDPDVVPFDFQAAGDKRTYKDMMSPVNLKEIALTANGIGPAKRYIVPANDKNEKQKVTSLIQDAHAAGLLVHPYTFRSEEQYLLKDYNKDPQKEYLDFFKLGVDGVFTDFSDQAIKAREMFLRQHSGDL